MAGYKGFSMSNNAIAAYESGEKPFSKWTKTNLLEAVAEAIEEYELEVHFNLELLKKVPVKVLKSELLYRSSWHHTSNHYNRTDFYSLDLNKLEELTEVQILDFVNQKETEKVEPKEEKWKCAFLEWSGTRKHPTATEIIEIGVIKGDWFIRSNGSKKKTTANGFRFIERLK